ncbi:MAG: hypothetical protein R2939_02730 [Kofleriaceae bacterium]
MKSVPAVFLFSLLAVACATNGPDDDGEATSWVTAELGTIGPNIGSSDSEVVCLSPPPADELWYECVCNDTSQQEVLDATPGEQRAACDEFCDPSGPKKVAPVGDGTSTFDAACLQADIDFRLEFFGSEFQQDLLGMCAETDLLLTYLSQVAYGVGCCAIHYEFHCYSP